MAPNSRNLKDHIAVEMLKDLPWKWKARISKRKSMDQGTCIPQKQKSGIAQGMLITSKGYKWDMFDPNNQDLDDEGDVSFITENLHRTSQTSAGLRF